MNTSEVLKENVTIPTKDLAGKLGMSKENIYKWFDGSQKNPLDRLEVILENSDSSAILNYLCHKNGGYYLKAPKVNQHSASICSEACKEFGELLTAVSISLEDGKVSKAEYFKIKKEWNDVMNVIQSALDGWEKELKLELMVH